MKEFQGVRAATVLDLRKFAINQANGDIAKAEEIYQFLIKGLEKGYLLTQEEEDQVWDLGGKWAIPAEYL